MAEVATPLRKEESTAEEIFRKLKDNEDKRKQQFWYRVYTFTFDPNGKTRRAWDLGLMALVLYSGFMAPYRAVFTRAPRAKIIYMDTEEWFIDGLFYFDIVLNFFTGYDNGYQVVTARKEIAKRYVWFNGRNSGFFWVDFIATVEWDLILDWITNGRTRVAWLALLKMLKVARMLRFGRLITRVTAHMKMHTGFVEAGKFFVYVLYVAHVLACLFFLWSELFECRRSTCVGASPLCDVGDAVRREECPEGCIYTSYMANEWDLEVHAPLMEVRCRTNGAEDAEEVVMEQLGCDDDESYVEQIDLTTRPENDCVPTSWRHAYSVAGVSINEMRPLSQWFQAFYWAITTMSTIGYGDRGPGNESELVFTIAAELIGLAFFALLIQTINNLKDVIGLMETQQKEVKNKLVDQMKRNDLDDDLIKKVVKFLNFKATSKAGRAFLKNDKDFQVLSPALQVEILRSTNYPYVKEVKIFGHSEEDQAEMDSVKVIFERANHREDDEDDGSDVGRDTLDENEINDLVLKLGVSTEYFTKERLGDAMRSMDSSGDGLVELDEFQNWWYMQRFHRPRMEKCPDSLLREIAEHVECIPASPGDVIVPRLHYGERFFVLQAGAVKKHVPTNTYGHGHGATDQRKEPVVVSHHDNDPFFGLQAVLPDIEFEKLRPRLAMMEIVVAEESYVECLSITREHLRVALEKVENVSRKGGPLDKIVRECTEHYDLRSRTRYEDDPAHAVITELTALAQQSTEEQEKSQLEAQKKKIQRLRNAAWEWTGVDGKVMRGCEQLRAHALKLAEEVTGGPGKGGPPDEVLVAALRKKTSGAVSESLWPEVEKMRRKVDGLERKVEATLHHAVRTNAILEALAKQQGIDVQAFGQSQGVGTDRMVGANDSASQNLSLQPASRQAPLASFDRRSGKQKADPTRPSPIRRKAEAEGMTIGFTSP